jgi:predicted SnoaL-like aldol condensation-catalyzing enzyme
MSTTPEQNKRLVLDAFDTLFNKRDYEAAKRYWSPNYIQHSAHIEPGRDGLFNLVRSAPPTLKYEPGLIVAEDNYVIVHGRFSGRGSSVNWIAADILLHRERGLSRTLGRASGRGHRGTVQEQSSDVRDELSEIPRAHVDGWAHDARLGRML